MRDEKVATYSAVGCRQSAGQGVRQTGEGEKEREETQLPQ